MGVGHTRTGPDRTLPPLLCYSRVLRSPRPAAPLLPHPENPKPCPPPLPNDSHSVKACMSGMEPSRGSCPAPSWT